MATKLFLLSAQTNPVGATYFDMTTSAGSSAVDRTTSTTNGGTKIQTTQTAGGAVIQWVSGEVPAGGFTLTTTDISIGARESGAGVNAGLSFGVFKRAPDGTETELTGSPFAQGSELGTTTATRAWVGNVTDTAFAWGDRLVLKLYAVNQGTMSAGSVILTHNGGAGTSNSWFNLAETVTFAAPSVVTSRADLAKTLGALTSSSTGTLAIAADLAKTLGAVTISATGTLAIAADLAKTLGAVTLSSEATGNNDLTADLAVTLGAVTLSSTATLAVAADLSQTLGAVTPSATGTLAIAAAESSTLGALTSSSAATLTIAADLAQTLGTVTLASSSALAIAADLAATLGAVTLSANDGTGEPEPEVVEPLSGGLLPSHYAPPRSPRRKDTRENDEALLIHLLH